MYLSTRDWFNLIACGYLDRLSRYTFTYIYTSEAGLMNSSSFH